MINTYKKIKILLITCILLSGIQNFKAQIIYNPSDSSGYDSGKLNGIGNGIPGGPVLYTDSSDYQPGSVVTITGTGFTPGEIVTVRVIHCDSAWDNDNSLAH